MSFKDISYLGHLQPFCSAERNYLCDFGKGIYEEHFEFGPVVQEGMPLKDISYLELWQPLCLKEQNYLSNLCRRHHEAMRLFQIRASCSGGYVA